MVLNASRAIKAAQFYSGEQATSADFNFMAQETYQNEVELLALLANNEDVDDVSTSDTVIAGLIATTISNLNVTLTAGCAVSFSGSYWSNNTWGWVSGAGNIFGVINPSDQVLAFGSNSGTYTRYDIVEIQPVLNSYNSSSRQFIDPVTQQVSTNNVNTRYEFGINIVIKPGNASVQNTYPTTDPGYIKVMEVAIPVGATTPSYVYDSRNTGLWNGNNGGTRCSKDLFYYIAQNAASSPFTTSLPLASANRGRMYIFQKTDSSANTVTVTVTGADTINGSVTSIVLSSQWDYVVLRAINSGNYIVIANGIGQWKSALTKPLGAGWPIALNASAVLGSANGIDAASVIQYGIGTLSSPIIANLNQYLPGGFYLTTNACTGAPGGLAHYFEVIIVTVSTTQSVQYAFDTSTLILYKRYYSGGAGTWGTIYDSVSLPLGTNWPAVLAGGTMGSGSGAGGTIPNGPWTSYTFWSSGVGPNTVILPPISSMQVGNRVTVYTGAAVTTINAAGSDHLGYYGGSYGTSFVLQACGDYVTLEYNPAGLWAVVATNGPELEASYSGSITTGTPGSGVPYNIGNIVLGPGVYDLLMTGDVDAETGWAILMSLSAALSTSSSSISDNDLAGEALVGMQSANVGEVRGSITKLKRVIITTSTTYYLIFLLNNGNSPPLAYYRNFRISARRLA